MSANRIAEIEALVQQVVCAAQEDDDPDVCATFEVVGREDAWVQVTNNVLNFAYPSDQDPLEHLSGPLSNLGYDIMDWEPQKFATFYFGEDDSANALASAIDAVLTQLFGLGEYAINAKLEHIPR
jgi:hypothetical protein